MSRQYWTLLAIVAGGSVTVPLVLGLALSWPTWLWGSLIVVLLIAIAMLVRRHYEQGQRGERYDYQRAGQPEHPAQHLVPNTPLDSVEANYKFLFSGTVFWSSINTEAGVFPAYQRDLAVQAILARARDITSTQQPDDHIAVYQELVVALGTSLPDQSGQVQARAVDITLTISDEDTELLRKRSELRKREQVWEQEQAFERNIGTYLGKEVLESPGSAVVWWLARQWLAGHTDEVPQAVPLIGNLVQLVAAANNTAVHEQFQHFVQEPPGHGAHSLLPTVCMDTAIGLVNELFPDPGDPQRTYFADDLAKIIDSHGVANDCVVRIRGTFGLDQSHEPPPADQLAP